MSLIQIYNGGGGGGGGGGGVVFLCIVLYFNCSQTEGSSLVCDLNW